jgi:hypothetical protein
MTRTNARHYTLHLKFGLFAILAALGLTAACSEAPTKAQPELAELLDRAAIEDLFNDYYAQFRSDTPQDFMSFFAADGRLEVNGWVVNGHDEIKDMYLQAGIIGGQEEEEEAPQEEGDVPEGVSETIYTNLDIDLQGDKAVATLIWQSIGADLLTSAPKITEYGTEWTELVKQDGRWLISHRIILSEGGMPEGELGTYPER